MSRVESLERNIARPISVIFLPLADKRYAFRNEASDSRFNFDGLCVN